MSELPASGGYSWLDAKASQHVRADGESAVTGGWNGCNEAAMEILTGKAHSPWMHQRFELVAAMEIAIAVGVILVILSVGFFSVAGTLPLISR
jgi:hypothetical protein